MCVPLILKIRINTNKPMKKTILWMFAAVLGGCLTLTSCGDDDDEKGVDVSMSDIVGTWEITNVTSDDPYNLLDEDYRFVTFFDDGLYVSQYGYVAYWGVDNGTIWSKSSDGKDYVAAKIVKFSKNEMVISYKGVKGTIRATYKRSSVPAIDEDILVGQWEYYDAITSPKGAANLSFNGYVTFFNDGTYISSDDSMGKWRLEDNNIYVVFDKYPDEEYKDIVAFASYDFLVFHMENKNATSLMALKRVMHPIDDNDGPTPDNDGPLSDDK